VSDAAKELKKILPVWAELTGVVIALICKVLLERDRPAREEGTK
jgi:hypothetical protein